MMWILILGLALEAQDVVAAMTDPDVTPARMCLIILLPLVIGMLAVTIVLVLWKFKSKEHHIFECGCLSALKLSKTDLHSARHRASSSVATDSKGDYLEEHEPQDSITSTAGLLPAKSKSRGEVNASTSCNAVPA